MSNRWGVLAVLFFIRTTMAVQFQSIAAVAPLLRTDFGFSLADIGILIGLYSAPGIALALPAGIIGHRFGDKNTVLAGIALMIVGGLIMAFLPSWGGQISGRVLAGIGGVLISVLMMKMVADHFAGKEISTAMAIFVSSWPIGIGIALLVLPPTGVVYGASAVHVAVATLIAVGAGLMAGLYNSPPVSTANPGGRPGLQATMALVFAALIWALFNVGFAMIFSFGPSMLVERGWSITAAGSAMSVVLWLTALSAPFGGVLADRTGHPDAIMLSSFLAIATLLIFVSRNEAIALSIIALGILCGLAVGPIMSLPALVLQPATRAIGMGVFVSVSYIGLVLGPALGGDYATWAGSAAAAFDFGAAALLICPLVLWVFHRYQRRVNIPVSAS
jgi:predicted MFS family arabinose efflux permease